MIGQLLSFYQQRSGCRASGTSGQLAICQKMKALHLSQWSDQPLDHSRFVVFDTETTGLFPHKGDEIISIGGVVINQGQLTNQTFFEYVNPNRQIPPFITELTGITDEMVNTASEFAIVGNAFFDFAGASMLVAHQGAFDLRFINAKMQKNCGETLRPLFLDTYILSQFLFPHRRTHSLDSLAKTYGVALTDRHTALGDSVITGHVFLAMIEDLLKRGIKTTADLVNSLKYRHLV